MLKNIFPGGESKHNIRPKIIKDRINLKKKLFREYVLLSISRSAHGICEYI